MQLPVFISGFRSGTTLLVNLMGLHPALAAWFETKELCEILRWLHVIKGRETPEFEAAYCIPAEPAGFSPGAVGYRALANSGDTFGKLAGSRTSGKAAHESYPLGFDCVLYTREQAAEALATWQQEAGDGSDYGQLSAATGKLIRHLSALQCTAAEKPFWVNKTPEIGRFAIELRECIGPCRMIYMVRDGLDVAASAWRLGWADMQTLSYNWKGLLQRTRVAMQDCPELYLELRYEDLVRNPQATLDKVLQFCGIGQSADGAAGIVKTFTASMGPAAFDTARLGNREGLTPEHVDIFMAEAGDLYTALGYPAC